MVVPDETVRLVHPDDVPQMVATSVRTYLRSERIRQIDTQKRQNWQKKAPIRSKIDAFFEECRRNQRRSPAEEDRAGRLVRAAKQEHEKAHEG